jgi:RNA-binding protein YlmH
MATINLGAIKFNWKGAYNSSTSYAVDDVVSSGGNSYVCIQAHSNQAVGKVLMVQVFRTYCYNSCG